ncbi:nucleoside-diphosphate-sugar epimerase [Streptomyces sp. LBL]|nr:nucleoside-diphosphate-sugar epimerase [Streptomyces sp. LBL]
MDVRGVTDAHMAAENAEAKGRYLVAAPTMTSFHDMARIIRGRYPRDLRLPHTALPQGPVRVLGPAFGLSQDHIRKHLGIRFRVDNSRGVRELGLRHRPIEETVLDHYEEWRQRQRDEGHRYVSDI